MSLCKNLLVLVVMVVVLGVGYTSQAFAETVYKIGGKTYSMEQVKSEAPSDFYDIQKKTYELIERKASEAYLDYFFEKQGKKTNKSPEEARALYFKEMIKVSDAQIKSTIAKYKSNPQLAKMGEKERWETIKTYLVNRERQTVVAQIISKAKKSKDLVVVYAKPQKPKFDIPVSSTDHVKGPASAKLTVVEFSDFECPYCSRAKNQVYEILKKYKGQVRVVFKHFPLSFHKNAELASEYACCAEEQGKFWEMHDKIFDNQRALKLNDLKKYSKALSLDEKKMDKCIQSSKCKVKIAQDKQLGAKLGVAGTPTFFINGRSSDYGLSDKAIEEALQAL